MWWSSLSNFRDCYAGRGKWAVKSAEVEIFIIPTKVVIRSSLTHASSSFSHLRKQLHHPCLRGDRRCRPPADEEKEGRMASRHLLNPLAPLDQPTPSALDGAPDQLERDLRARE